MAGQGALGAKPPDAKHFRNGLPAFAGEPQPEDEAGAYTHEQLLKMDAAFSDRLERCFREGKESRESARRNYDKG